MAPWIMWDYVATPVYPRPPLFDLFFGTSTPVAAEPPSLPRAGRLRAPVSSALCLVFWFLVSHPVSPVCVWTRWCVVGSSVGRSRPLACLSLSLRPSWAYNISALSLHASASMFDNSLHVARLCVLADERLAVSCGGGGVTPLFPLFRLSACWPFRPRLHAFIGLHNIFPRACGRAISGHQFFFSTAGSSDLVA